MKKPSFLTKLKAEDKLKLVEPSEEICSSYIEKADNCFKSAKILFQNKERIDKQYYVTSEKNFVLTKESAKDMVEKSEDFLVKMKLIISELKNEEIENIRSGFEKLY